MIRECVTESELLTERIRLKTSRLRPDNRIPKQQSFGYLKDKVAIKSGERTSCHGSSANHEDKWLINC